MSLWDPLLTQGPPRTSLAPASEDGLQALWLDSVPWRGRTTRVFAYLGLPASAQPPLPAMVLVHGGGGTAYASWVRWWNERGYAAIAIDTCGCVAGGAFNARARHEQGGPPGWGGFDQLAEPLADQWTYHAVAAILRAHDLLRAHPLVDARRIGVTGNSWGGYLTAIAAAADPRWRFAIPVYGCGYLAESPFFTSGFAVAGAQAERWSATWDAAVHLPRASCPMLWINGATDPAFPFIAWARSSRLARGPRTLSLRPELAHADGDTIRPAESWRFAEHHCRGAPALARVGPCEHADARLSASYVSAIPLRRAELAVTDDAGDWRARRWRVAPARIDASASTVVAEVPATATAAFLMLVDEREAIVSSEPISLGAAAGCS